MLRLKDEEVQEASAEEKMLEEAGGKISFEDFDKDGEENIDECSDNEDCKQDHEKGERTTVGWGVLQRDRRLS